MPTYTVHLYKTLSILVTRSLTTLGDLQISATLMLTLGVTTS